MNALLGNSKLKFLTEGLHIKGISQIFGLICSEISG